MEELKVDATKEESQVRNWYHEKKLSREFLKNLLDEALAGVYVDWESQMVIELGMFYYAEDKSFSKDIIVGKQVSGVVAYVDETGRHGLILLLQQKNLPWSSDLLYAELPKGLNGKENTRLILDAAKKQGKKAEAVEWCANYAYDGIKAGEAFLASRGDWEKIGGNVDMLNQSLRKIGRVVFLDGCLYCSSSEHSNSYAWSSDFSRLYGERYSIKYLEYTVRPVMAF